MASLNLHRRDEDRSGGLAGRPGSRKEAPKAGVVLRLGGGYLETAEIGLFACNPKKHTFNSNG